jgi:glutathione peroxidase-family protein
MTRARNAAWACWAVLGMASLCNGHATAQETKKAAPQAGAGDSLEAINAEYLRELTALEAKRMERLARLAESAQGDAAHEALVAYFQAALTSGQYRVAEPLAERVIKAGHADPSVLYMAQVTNILAEVDRGAYDESLESLAQALRAGGQADGERRPASFVLPRSTRLSVAETYYQKLVQADQFETARKAFRLIRENSADATIRAFADARLARLETIGKPAPEIKGTDIDGRPFDLAEQKGHVVLVVFWATWCIPSGPEAEMIDQVYAAYGDRGFRVVGINMDAAQEGVSPESVLPAVRRFLVEHNVRAPVLVNGAGGQDYAAAYGVTEIPTNFLVDRAGRIIDVDLTAANIDRVIGKALGAE